MHTHNKLHTTRVLLGSAFAAGVIAASGIGVVPPAAAFAVDGTVAAVAPAIAVPKSAALAPNVAAVSPEPVCAGESDSVLEVMRAASNPYDDVPRDTSTWTVEAHSVAQFPQVTNNPSDVDALIEWFKGLDDGAVAALPLAQTAALTSESVQIEGLSAGYYVIRAVHGNDTQRITKPSLVSLPNYIPEYGCWSYSAQVALKSMPNTPPTPPPPPENPPSKTPQTGSTVAGTALLALGSISLGVVLAKRRKKQQA